MNGWIKLYRKMLDNPYLCGNANRIAVWIYLLLNATHDEQQGWFKKRSILLKKGQLITGRVSIKRATGVNEKTVQRIIFELQNEQLIEQQTSNKNRLITILNWDKYQSNERQNELQTSFKRASNEQPVSTNNNDKNEKNENNTLATGVAGKIKSSAQEKKATKEKKQDVLILSENSSLNGSPPGCPAPATPIAPSPQDTRELNKTIVEVLDIFRVTNKSVKNMYGNITQRKAIEELVDLYGHKHTIDAAKYAVMVQGENYAPVITTPLALYKKFTDLWAYSKRQNKKEESNFVWG